MGVTLPYSPLLGPYVVPPAVIPFFEAWFCSESDDSEGNMIMIML